ncbi:hypothetical protein Hdeb2414_s0004g00131601 [Helianthus debilis subsp. tardiflorus]
MWCVDVVPGGWWRWWQVGGCGQAFLFVHYNGHGTRLPTEIGDDDDIGYDECIVPCDFNPINDMVFVTIGDVLALSCTELVTAFCDCVDLGVGGGKWREVVVTSRRRWW